MPTIAETIAFIKMAHEGQTDDLGVAYYLHPIAVMELLPPDTAEDVKLAALLHDVPDDTAYDLSYLAMLGYSARTLRIVRGMSKAKGDTRTYDEKIAAIIASDDPDLILVKRCDVKHNSDEERHQPLKLIAPERFEHYSRKYAGPLQALNAACGLH